MTNPGITGPLPADEKLRAIDAQLIPVWRVLHGKKARGDEFQTEIRSSMSSCPTHDMDAIREQLKALRDAIDSYLKG